MVVVLPLVPVMATIGALQKVAAYSSSPITFLPFFIASSIKGKSSGTPGLTIIRSYESRLIK